MCTGNDGRGKHNPTAETLQHILTGGSVQYLATPVEEGQLVGGYARQIECLCCSNSRGFVHHTEARSVPVSQAEALALPAQSGADLRPLRQHESDSIVG